MKIVNLTTFLSMPEGTVFCKYKPCVFDDISIKFLNAGHSDFWYVPFMTVEADDSGALFDLLDRAETTGESFNVDLESEYRDGLFNEDQLFAIWEPEDVRKLIAKLQGTLS